MHGHRSRVRSAATIAVVVAAVAGCTQGQGSSRATQAPSATPEPSPAVSAVPVTGAAPPAPSCTAGTKALAAGQSRSCQFTASRSGGANAFYAAAQPESERTGAADVVVSRGATTMSYDVYHAKSGCLQGIIQAGDRVRVTVRQGGATGHADFQVSAGGGFGCN